MRFFGSHLFFLTLWIIEVSLKEEKAEKEPHFIVDLPPYTEPSNHLTSSTDSTPTRKPMIDASTPTNVTVIKGKTAILACVVRNLGTASVSWLRLRDISLMALNEITNTKDKRIQAIHIPKSDRWALRIQETKLSDDGIYECQVTTPKPTIKLINLRVLDPETKILGPVEVFLNKGSTLNLTCTIKQGPKKQPFILWSHNSKMLKYLSPEDGVLNVDKNGVITTQIIVEETDVQHSGEYRCEPGAAPAYHVNVHVLSGKLPAAMQKAGAQIKLDFYLTVFMVILNTFRFLHGRLYHK
ncbi:kin of IRRE-like protein 1 [Lepeophtheirus salmonis]|uniref:kin of IRRE-like protein 1 n=1 Tax=Lepeophtheirus salmonis TaxID=72036 RepID=UPI001AE3F3FC|nr:zwei Ig domain protein zig-8-like [Lepeophtheirus salmonis]